MIYPVFKRKLLVCLEKKLAGGGINTVQADIVPDSLKQIMGGRSIKWRKLYADMRIHHDNGGWIHRRQVTLGQIHKKFFEIIQGGEY